MDDDGSKSLDFHEFKKGIHDYGVDLEINVSNNFVKSCMPHPSITRKEGSGDHVYNASCSSDQNWLCPIRFEILNSLLSSTLLTVHVYSQPCNLHTFEVRGM